MILNKGFGKHKYFDRLSFWTSLKIKSRTLTQYSAVPLTKKQIRKFKKDFRKTSLIPIKDLARHHDETCRLCKM